MVAASPQGCLARPRAAASICRSVQAAKKYALGPRHDISTLSSVVAEPWLSVVIKDAAAAEQSGWFWTYKLDSLEVCVSHPLPLMPHTDVHKHVH